MGIFRRKVPGHLISVHPDNIAKKDGVIRHHALRRDGTVRDTVIYSILAAEWPDVRRHLDLRMARHAANGTQ